jgi:DNA polymerase I
MKCRFLLMDIDAGEWEGKPSCRLWGLNANAEPILVVATTIMPYFYLVPQNQEDTDAIREELTKNRERFPKILRIESESKKLLGRDCEAVKVTCSDSQVLGTYARDIAKIRHNAQCFEQDLRLSTKYIADWMLTPCGWHECEADGVKLAGVDVAHAYLAKTAPRSILEEKAPELRILSYALLTAAEKGSARPKRDPIRAIAVATNSGNAEVFASETQDDSTVLKAFITYVINVNPDVIVGFESNELEWPYILERCRLQKIRMAVSRDLTEPHTSVFGHVSVSGRANVDLLEVANGIPEVKVKTVENMAKYLGLASAEKITTIEESERYMLWMDSAKRIDLLESLKSKAQALVELAEATMNYPMQLSALTGLPLDQVMTAAVGFRVDSYLVRQAHLVGELIPPRVEQPFFTYRGAIVLKPQTGLHDDVVVLDFASMYPNLMKNYNLSPDTLIRPGEQVSDDAVFIIPELGHRFRKKPDGFYRIVLSALIDERSIIRNELAKVQETSIGHRVLKERERALKVITNACYGYAGWAGARWYVREVAESAAALGRNAITKTVAEAEALGLKVIYGDTDSVFVRNGPEKVNRLLEWADNELGLEIKRERQYIRVLFTEAMKRYAGLLPDGSLDVVGLEVVRGDWSDLARRVQERVLESILRDKSVERAVETVRIIVRELKKGELPIGDLVIRKALTKPIGEYAVRTPHVEVAKILRKEGWDLAVGDQVAYVIARGPGKLFQKARPFGQVRPQDVDVEYYLQSQVKPAAMRVLEGFGVKEAELV